MKTLYAVPVSERLPENEGLYYTNIGELHFRKGDKVMFPHQCFFEKGTHICQSPEYWYTYQPPTAQQATSKSLDEFLNAVDRILELHSAEQEGITEGMPTPKMWIEAVNNLSEARENFKPGNGVEMDLERLSNHSTAIKLVDEFDRNTQKRLSDIKDDLFCLFQKIIEPIALMERGKIYDIVFPNKYKSVINCIQFEYGYSDLSDKREVIYMVDEISEDKRRNKKRKYYPHSMILKCRLTEQSKNKGNGK